jgi:hypothetical protein
MFEGGASRPRFFRGLTGNSFQVFTRSNQNPLALIIPIGRLVDFLELCKLKVILFESTRRILQQRVCVYEVCGGGCSGTFAVKEKVKEPLFQTGESLAVLGVICDQLLHERVRV